MNAADVLAGRTESLRSDAPIADVSSGHPDAENRVRARFGHPASSLLLSEDELFALTKRERPKVQARILKQIGIPFTIHPVDGVLLVARDAARSILLGDVAANDSAPPVVNVEAIRRRAKHGKAANAGR